METKMQNILFYANSLASFNYGENHPFKPARAKLFYELLNRYSLIVEPNQMIMPPPKLDDELLFLFHTARYVELLKLCNQGELTIDMLDFGIGSSDNPILKGILDFALEMSGATYEGAMMLARGEADFIFNPHGGFHHARAEFAEGFCYVNDIAIAITSLINLGQRVFYCDIDAHHGNGVQDAFYEDDRVLTVSMHESGQSLFPWGGFEDETGIGRGRGFNVNIPFLQGTDDDIYLGAFNEIVPPLVAAFNPDILFIEIGADAHKDDPLAHLNLTSRSYKTILKTFKALCPKIIATGGGGYNTYKTAAIWALSWATICGLKVLDSFAGLVGGMMYGPESSISSLEDEPFILTGPEKQQCMEEADRIVQYIKKKVFPIHGIAI